MVIPEGQSPSCSWRGRQVAIADRFEILGDYLWKLPRFIDSEIDIESKKLGPYPSGGDDPEDLRFHRYLWRRRFEMEFGKLSVDFPTLMGGSSLIQVVSEFEFALLEICRDIEDATGVDLNAARGRDRGPRGLIRYAMTAGVVAVGPEPVALEQVERAIEFRNCLAHAGGLIDEYRAPGRIRETIDQRLYFPADIRRRERTSRYDPDPRIVVTDAGDRLHIPMLYAHWLSAAARNTLCDLCLEARTDFTSDQAGEDRGMQVEDGI